MKSILKFIWRWLILGLFVFGFFSLCNWSFEIGYWNGFSRFLLAIIGCIFIFGLIKNIHIKVQP